MSSTTRSNTNEGVEFVHEDDGQITAVDLETGVTSFGETKALALSMLAEALDLHEGGGESVTDVNLGAWGLDPDTVGDKIRPECLN